MAHFAPEMVAQFNSETLAHFHRNTHLGACNPKYAYQALQTEPWIGSMLPCNVVVQEFEDGQIEIAAVDPLASMQAVENPALEEIATTIRAKLQQVVGAV